MIVATAPPMDDGRLAVRRQQVVVIRDETEVEATRRLRDTVLANISHEFKTPLAAQLASIELLLDQLPDLSTDQIAGLVVSLQSGTVRLTQLIDNLLESVRIEAGQSQVSRKPVALDEVVERAAELVRPLLDQRGQTLSVDLPYPLPIACGDAARLAQVFVKLLANASKYAPAGSAVRVGGLAAADSITIWVEDEGPGLPNVPQAALFGRFVRVAAEPDTGGVGLGLWLVKSIVERHDGQVSASNTGRGARVSVTLPRFSPNEDSSR
jgi:K+-sensing histidine kinase KdpD